MNYTSCLTRPYFTNINVVVPSETSQCVGLRSLTHCSELQLCRRSSLYWAILLILYLYGLTLKQFPNPLCKISFKIDKWHAGVVSLKKERHLPKLCINYFALKEIVLNWTLICIFPISRKLEKHQSDPAGDINVYIVSNELALV